MPLIDPRDSVPHAHCVAVVHVYNTLDVDGKCDKLVTETVTGLPH